MKLRRAILALVLVFAIMAIWIGLFSFLPEHEKKGVVLLPATPIAPRSSAPIAPASLSGGNLAPPALPPAVIVAQSTAAATDKLATPLRFSAGPRDGEDIVKNAMMRALPGGSPPIARLRPPLIKYSLARGAGLESATEAGFLYFAEDASGHLVAGGDIMDPSGSGSYRMRHVGLANADFAGGGRISAALEELSNTEQVRTGSYEVRLLTIPVPHVRDSQFFDALWLVSDSGSPALVYQLPRSNLSLPLPYGLQGGKLYPAEQFQKSILQP